MNDEYTTADKMDGGGGGRTHPSLTFAVSPFTTHPFRDRGWWKMTKICTRRVCKIMFQDIRYTKKCRMTRRLSSSHSMSQLENTYIMLDNQMKNEAPKAYRRKVHTQFNAILQNEGNSSMLHCIFHVPTGLSGHILGT